MNSTVERLRSSDERTCPACGCYLTARSSKERAPLEHELKAWPPHYARLADGSKTFELRWNDRDYRAGDTLHIIEFNPESECYTGCSLKRRISYVMEGQFGLEPGWVALGLAPETGCSNPRDKVALTSKERVLSNLREMVNTPMFLGPLAKSQIAEAIEFIEGNAHETGCSNPRAVRSP